jgi:GntR family transcriptional regulator
MSEPTDQDQRSPSRRIADDLRRDIESGARRPLMRLGANRYSRRLREETGLSPFRIEAMKQGRTPRVETRSVGIGPAPADVVDRLGLRPGSDVVHRVNWYFADDEPVQFGVTYIPVEIAGDSPLFTQKSLGTGSIYARFEELGWPVARIREEISARMPTPDEAGVLSVPPGVPVIEVLHTSMDDWKRPFEVTRLLMRADLNGLDYDMPVED